MAGIAPGIMMGAALMLTQWWPGRGRLNLLLGQRKRTPREIWQSLVSWYLGAVLPGDYYRRLPFRTFSRQRAGAVAAFYAHLCRRGYIGDAVFRSLRAGSKCRQNDVGRRVSGGRGGIRTADYDRGITRISWPDLLHALVDSPRLLLSSL